MLNIILGNYTYLQRFLLHLYEIKNTQDEKERYSFNKLCDKKALALIPPNTEGQTDAILQEGFTISDAIKGNAINRINMIIDKWTARKDGDSI